MQWCCRPIILCLISQKVNLSKGCIRQKIISLKKLLVVLNNLLSQSHKTSYKLCIIYIIIRDTWLAAWYVVSHVMRGQPRDACPAYCVVNILSNIGRWCCCRSCCCPVIYTTAAFADAPSCCPVAVININIVRRAANCADLSCCCPVAVAYDRAIVSAALLSIRCCCCLRTRPAQSPASRFSRVLHSK